MSNLYARDGISTVDPPLSQAVGYVVVVVIGIIIAFIMMLVTKVLKKTAGEDNKKTEMFMTANRTVRTGLTASAVISSWLWSTALLGSSFVGYSYGIAGPFWFAAGCSPMIVFFALLGISCKRKIPEAHTSLEVVRIRYGRVAHVVFMVLCLVNNIFACANMLLGASAVITAAFSTDQVGSIEKLFDLVQAAAQRHPVSGNYEGTYLTMTSKSAILFAILHTCSNFGLVIMDTSYFIKAFSAKPSSVVPGYTIGGIAYFSIPWALGTVMSSVALGLENQSNFPTFPRVIFIPAFTTLLENCSYLITENDIFRGKGGATAVLLIIFMAVTSTLSAQVIAVSSILSFDVYREYFNKSATDKDLIRSSHFGVVFFAAFSAGFSTMLHYVGIDLGWTLYMLGVVTCPGIFPMVFTVLWRKHSKAAAILSPILGLATGLAVWLGTASRFFGEVSVATTGEILPCVYGTVASCFSPILYSVVITLIKPQNYDWVDFKKEKLALEKLDSELTTVHHDESTSQNVPGSIEQGGVHSASTDAQELKRWGRIAAFWSIATFLGHWVIWPLPMYGSHYIFGKKFFVAWVVVAIIWLWGTMLVAICAPLLDGGIQQIVQVYHGLTGKGQIPATSNDSKEVGVASTSASQSGGSLGEGKEAASENL
ncbi:unnamed protein product [Penicillium manginii]